MRSERNYEAEFKNITYSDAKEIAKDENVKEISIYQDMGTSEEDINTYSEIGSSHLNIIAYDENAIKNNHVKLIDGRFAKNTNEIVMKENSLYEIGEKITVTINNEKNTYTVVGIAEGLPNETIGNVVSFNYKMKGLTYYDKSKIKDSDIVNITILTNDIQKIYDTTENLCKSLNLYETEEKKQNNLTYYDKLLNYALVPKQGTQNITHITIDGEEAAIAFEEDMRNIAFSLIGIISIASIIVIYTGFKISYSERIKELGMLTSIRNE